MMAGHGFTVTKTYGHEEGLSCVFRQWRAKSHCAQLHGYALSFAFTFGCNVLDENGWVVDFGSLGPLRQFLHRTFDHTMLVAVDDPDHAAILLFAEKNLAQVIGVERTGCEAFAQLAHTRASEILHTSDNIYRGVRVISVRVAEHGGNAATYNYG